MITRYYKEDVNSLTVYHASPVKFNKFEKTNDIGFHFGNKEQAFDRMKQQKIKNFYLYECRIKFNKLLRTIDKKTWFGMNLLDILSVNKFVNRKEMLEVLDNLKKEYKYDVEGKIISGWSEKALREWNDKLKDILYNLGYDGIIYKNKYENKKEFSDSYILLKLKILILLIFLILIMGKK